MKNSKGLENSGIQKEFVCGEKNVQIRTDINKRFKNIDNKSSMKPTMKMYQNYFLSPFLDENGPEIRLNSRKQNVTVHV